MNAVPPHLVPKHDVATLVDLTALSEATVRRRCAEGQWPHSRFGNAIRFSDHDVALILAAARRTDEPTPVYEPLTSSAIV